jgi:uracil-DNA glycosylase family 4
MREVSIVSSPLPDSPAYYKILSMEREDGPVREDSWEQLIGEVEACTACRLCETRGRAVPGEGDRSARVLFVGEGPGAEEDRQGRPFVGPAGMLLEKMLRAINLKREDVYIANIIKCRPPGNRVPADTEAKACLPFLRRQLKLISPRVIVCLGTTAARYVMDPDARVTRDRGRWMERSGFSMLATYHPAALLRDETLLIDAWRDIKMLEKKLAELEAMDA